MENTQTQVLSIKDWFITLLIAAIPIVGFIMLFVWGFGDGTNPGKANWAKATLLWIGVFVVFYTLIAIIFGASLLTALA